MTVLNATGTSSTNTGSVRLQSTEFWGPLVSSAGAGLVMNLQTINNWPVSDYDFAGNGVTAAQDPAPAAFSVDSGAIALPAGTAAGDPLWVNGFTTPFGSAPPDFTAVAVNNELSVQTAGGQVGGARPDGTGHPDLRRGQPGMRPREPAGHLDAAHRHHDAVHASCPTVGFSIDLSNAAYVSGVIRIGPESIDLKSLPASPLVVPTTLPVTSTFAPRFGYGNPKTSTTTPTTTLTTALDRVQRLLNLRHRIGRRVERDQPRAAARGARRIRSRDQHVYRDQHQLRALN